MSSALCGLHGHSALDMDSANYRLYDFKPLDKNGEEVSLEQYRGKVVLIVNTASQCGFTPQFAGLESLRYKLREQYPDDFEILGFPCNQFMNQDPKSDEDIQSFCQVNYGVSFPIMKKVEVNGEGATPLFEWLKNEQPGLMGLRRVKWNFEKFLVGRDGRVKGRWASTTKPDALEKHVVDELKKPKPTGSGDVRASEAISTTTDEDLKPAKPEL